MELQCVGLQLSDDATIVEWSASEAFYVLGVGKGMVQSFAVIWAVLACLLHVCRLN